MKWSKFVSSVGSSPDDLRAQIEELRNRFEQHSHTSLTGGGAGQNDVAAETSLPGFPDGGASSDADADGVADMFDACPDTLLGVLVDATGCSIRDFCAAQVVQSICRTADWRGDEGEKPRDCRWRNQACEVMPE